jgi:hypothetical protein
MIVMTKSKEKPAISACMDHRMNDKLDQLGGLSYRTAGAHIGPTKHSINRDVQEGRITELHIVSHTTCGAMQFTRSAIEGSRTVEDEGLFKAFVKPFQGVPVESLDSRTREIQNDVISRIVAMAGRQLPVKFSQEDTKPVDLPASKALIVVNPVNTDHLRYADIAGLAGRTSENTYFVTYGGNPWKTRNDVVLARGLGIKRVIVMPDKREGAVELEKVMKMLRAEQQVRDQVELIRYRS